MVDMKFLMKQAKKMQEQMQEQMAELRITAQAGGGAIQVTVNGHKEVTSVKVEDESVLQDKEMLEDLMLAALSEAYRQVDEQVASNLKGMPGQMFPGMF